MKTIIIGDIHGRSIWKEIVKKENPDKTIFLGDYVDSFDINGRDQIDNFKEILDYAKNNNTVLLYGNHEHHYLIPEEKYSGFQLWFALEIKEALEKCISDKILNIIHIQNNVIFSHAGVTKTWLKSKLIELEEINNYFYFNINAFNFSGVDMTGDDITQSPIWVRHKSLLKDKIDDYVQVVGHTETIAASVDGVVFLDSLKYNQYGILKNNEIKLGELK